MVLPTKFNGKNVCRTHTAVKIEISVKNNNNPISMFPNNSLINYSSIEL